MAEPRYFLGCGRILQDRKCDHSIWSYPLMGLGRSSDGLFWAKFAFLCTIFMISFVGSYGTTSPYESVLAVSVNDTNSRISVDNILQDYAFRAINFTHPRTGIIYEGTVPANLSGIKVDGVRLRSGSLRRRGYLYNEFTMPTGIVVSPYVERLVLVYQNFQNLSSLYYSTPEFQLVAPILGLLAYDASNLNATNPQELSFIATESPISIRFSNVSSTKGSTPRCIFYNLNGTVSLSNVSSTNVCSSNSQGHFSLVIESVAPAPAPSPVTPPSPPSPSGGVPPTMPTTPSSGLVPPPGKTSQTWKVAVGSSIGGVAAAVLVGILCFGFLKYREKSQIEHMELQAEQAETLQTSVVGGNRTLIAGGTRTQPMLENEYTA
ncbi:hypothetical protein SUGI_0455690 [Cryptomeria japonica]|uniref:uncharacterized protein LOC131039856 n=1 Tax=Cryptomeria japonica TaxID=3369 RepID=UPI002408CBB5|nr:uncharacterized protein LOC131039856 [Cryptomeria japonica]GLJ23973.1 hypothetical protein SUGI_0455690 [Cryptomeria japonica]